MQSGCRHATHGQGLGCCSQPLGRWVQVGALQLEQQAMQPLRRRWGQQQGPPLCARLHLEGLISQALADAARRDS